METVANFPDLASARLAESVLKARGVHSLIPDQHFVGVDWSMATALQGIRLQVDQRDLEAARLVLVEAANLDGEPSEARDEADDERDLCPRCRSSFEGQPAWKRRLKALSLFFPPVILLWPLFAIANWNHACASCGHPWKSTL